MAENTTRDAKAFAESYTPSEGDHPDLESRVVMYRRAVDSGDRRAEAVHARTLMRFVGHLGYGTATTAGPDSGPSKADLQARAAELDLPTSGTKAALASRIAEAENADQGEG